MDFLGNLGPIFWCVIPALVVIVVTILAMGIRVLNEYERGVVFTLGKFSGVRGPGLTVLIPLIQIMRKVDMRLKTAEVPRQEVMTRDNISVLVNAVVYFKVVDPEAAIIKIEDYVFAIRQYTQAALRDVIGNNEMDAVLTERVQIAESIKEIVDNETSDWGVDIESIKIQELEVPAEMKRAMARQAEAERERRATIIASQGNFQRLKTCGTLLKRFRRPPGRCTCAHCKPYGTLPRTHPRKSSCLCLPTSGRLPKTWLISNAQGRHAR